ncbi:MAG: DUF6285 domain-containing protein [Rhodospirillales bacterium]|nr:DUF6285 domain-containing protein [Rhodospirillales bacterium]
MREHPSGKDLLELARKVLRQDLIEHLPKDKKFEALMVANAMAIAARQFELGDEPETGELASLVDLYGEAGEPGDREDLQNGLSRLYRHLCREIRNGAYDPGTPQRSQVFTLLMQAAIQKVIESNPKYLGKNT